MLNSRSHITTIIAAGIATFFFGFGGPAILNVYLLATHSPLVLQFRSSLMFISAIIGDGIILPIVNMVAVSFLLRYKELVNRLRVILSLIFGLSITAYVHIVQATLSLVNWSMPKPWEWNFIGVWHAVYMFAASTLTCLFYIVLLAAFKKGKKPIKEAVFVSFCILVFFILLRIDYIADL